MKGKTSLTLLELTVMLLVFALAAALCLQAFVWADRSSARVAREDGAYRCLQNASEVLKACGGDTAAAARRFGGNCVDGKWQIAFDENWNVTQQEGAFFLQAVYEQTGAALLGGARLEITDREGSVLAAWSVRWQEVAP